MNVRLDLPRRSLVQGTPRHANSYWGGLHGTGPRTLQGTYDALSGSRRLGLGSSQLATSDALGWSAKDRQNRDSSLARLRGCVRLVLNLLYGAGFLRMATERLHYLARHFLVIP